jgi:hypothetical protein
MPNPNPNAPGADQSANLPSISDETSSALDALLKQQEDAVGPAPGTTGNKGPTGPASAEPIAEPRDPKTGKFLPKTQPAASGTTGPSGAVTEPVTPPVSGSPDAFADVQAPQLKGKSAEAFENIKRLANEKVTALQSERDAFEKQIKELTEKAGRLDPKVEAELKDLREFRRKLDVEADPEFKKFDEESAVQTESIYGKLLSVGVPEHTIEKIKSMGGVFKVQWDPILEKLPSAAKRFIEVKLTQLEDLKEKKSTAIASAKKNSEEFLTQRAQAGETAKKEFREKAATTLDTMLPKLDWFVEKKPTDKSTPEEKASIGEHNKLLTETKEAIKEAIDDDSAEMRAFLAVGLAQLMKLRADYSAATSAHKSEVTKLKAELDAANALLEKVKKGSTNRLRDTTAIASIAAAGAGSINEKPADALDRARAEVEARRG